MMYQYEGFVSYAHVDDEPLMGVKDGWVTTLVTNLQKELRRKLGRKNASLWMDHGLTGNEPLTPALMEKIRQSATLIIIVSPGYLASEWCQREREEFIRLVREKNTNGSRVFLVERDQVDRNDLPSEFRDLLGYPYWVKDNNSNISRTLGMPIPRPDEQDYYDRLNKLSSELANEIRKLTEQSDTPPPEKETVVFLAEVTDDLDDLRSQVEAYLKQAKLVVLPHTLYPRHDTEAFQQAVVQDLKQCKLFVQLLSEVPGKRLPGLEERFTKVQYEYAVRADIQILQWRRRDLALDEVTDEKHRSLLEQVTVRACGIEELKKAVVDQAFYQPPPQRKNENCYVYVNTDAEDRELANRLGEFLGKNQIWVELPGESGDPSEIRKKLEEGLRECHGVIYVYGRAPVTWIDNQLSYSRKILWQREQPLRCLALCEAPSPLPRSQPSIHPPNLLRIDCSNGIDEAELMKFINRLRREYASS